MKSYLILCVDDEREVLDSVINDLSQFEPEFAVEGAESVEEAQHVIAEYHDQNTPLALIVCDHIMPARNGVDFLIELANSQDTAPAKKILLTGQAALEDTVEAVNHACLDYYIAKPWTAPELVAAIKTQLSQFIIDTQPDVMPWVSVLDSEMLLDEMSKRRTQYGE